MSYYVLYNKNTNHLIDVLESTITDIDEDLTLEIREGDIPDPLLYAQNTSTLNFEKKKKKIYSKLEFLSKFTLQERITARASADPIVKDFLSLLDIAEFVNLEDITTIQAVNYLALQGIITEQRAQEILS